MTQRPLCLVGLHAAGRRLDGDVVVVDDLTSRNGPGRISTVPFCAKTLLKTTVRFCRSRVGSPFTSMNCVVCVTGSNTMQNSDGSCTDISAF